jgi:hypothetical protein
MCCFKKNSKRVSQSIKRNSQNTRCNKFYHLLDLEQLFLVCHNPDVSPFLLITISPHITALFSSWIHYLHLTVCNLFFTGHTVSPHTTAETFSNLLAGSQPTLISLVPESSRKEEGTATVLLTRVTCAKRYLPSLNQHCSLPWLLVTLAPRYKPTLCRCTTIIFILRWSCWLHCWSGWPPAKGLPRMTTASMISFWSRSSITTRPGLLPGIQQCWLGS